MLLVIDAGNTNTVLGVFDNNTLIGHWRISTHKSATSDELGVIIGQLLKTKELRKEMITDIVISSVIPSEDQALQKMAEDFFSLTPYFVRPGQSNYIPIAYKKPEEVGADRIVNAVAALHLYGKPAIIIDFGTAITFCVISDEGQYLGGCIFPGLHISASALFKSAAKLIPVELGRPEQIIGQSTKEAVQAGFYWGFSSMVNGVVEKISAQLKTPPFIIATGGCGHLFQSSCPSITAYDEHLTLKGLQIIYQYYLCEK